MIYNSLLRKLLKWGTNFIYFVALSEKPANMSNGLSILNCHPFYIQVHFETNHLIAPDHKDQNHHCKNKESLFKFLKDSFTI
jgi:hypothetical protein